MLYKRSISIDERKKEGEKEEGKMEREYVQQQRQRDMRRAEERLARNREEAARRARGSGPRFRRDWPALLLLGLILCSLTICCWQYLFPRRGNPLDLCASDHESASKASNERSEASRGSNRRILLSWDTVTGFNRSEGPGTKDYEPVPMLLPPPPMCPKPDFIQELISMVPVSVCSELSGCSEDVTEATVPALRSCYLKKCFCVRVCVEMDTCSEYGTEAIAPATGTGYQALALPTAGKPEIVAER